ATQSVTLHLEPVAAAAPPPAGEPEEGASEAADEGAASPRHGKMRVGAWTALGVGAAGVIVGSVFVLKNHSSRGDANALCNAGQCPEAQRAAVQAADSDANSAATIAWISYGVGVVGLAAGAALLWLSRKGSSSAHSASASPAGQVVPWVSARSAGLTVTF
ncbi:MAG: hypothetical protein ACREJ3_04560, partial [Polyangiaceae bacterium]